MVLLWIQMSEKKSIYANSVLQFSYPAVPSFQITAIQTITLFQSPKATQPKHALSFTLLISDPSRCLASPISFTSGADDSAVVLTKASYRWSISFIIQDDSLSSCPAHSSKTMWKRVRDEHQWFQRMRAYCSLWLDIVKGLGITLLVWALLKICFKGCLQNCGWTRTILVDSYFDI